MRASTDRHRQYRNSHRPRRTALHRAILSRPAGLCHLLRAGPWVEVHSTQSYAAGRCGWRDVTPKRCSRIRGAGPGSESGLSRPWSASNVRVPCGLDEPGLIDPDPHDEPDPELLRLRRLPPNQTTKNFANARSALRRHHDVPPFLSEPWRPRNVAL